MNEGFINVYHLKKGVENQTSKLVELGRQIMTPGILLFKDKTTLWKSNMASWEIIELKICKWAIFQPWWITGG